MIDLHCHVLPGIDDGPATLDAALALARAAAAGGTRAIVATPHVSLEYRNTAREIERRVDDFNRQLASSGIAIEVHRGAEIAMTMVEELSGPELTQLTLGHGRWLLIEPPFSAVLIGFDLVVAELQQRGYGVVVAHPERCPAFHRDRDLLDSLVGSGALLSVTAGALVGRFGRPVHRFAHELFARGLVHNVASDAHDARRRPPGMARELTDAGLAPLRSWLTDEVPGAVVGGERIPPRPEFRPPDDGIRGAGFLRRIRDRGRS